MTIKSKVTKVSHKAKVIRQNCKSKCKSKERKIRESKF